MALRTRKISVQEHPDTTITPLVNDELDGLAETIGKIVKEGLILKLPINVQKTYPQRVKSEP